MRVVLTSPYSWPEVRRGGERILAETAAALARRGHDVVVLTSGEQPSDGIEDGARVIRLERRHRKADRHERWFARRAARLLPDLAPDAVHTLMPRDAAAAIDSVGRRGTPVVYQDLGLPLREWWSRHHDHAVRRRIVDDVDVYACFSHFGAAMLEEQFGRRAEVIPGGVDLEQFRPAPSREARPTLLFSGALEEERKGLATLLTAAEDLIAEVPDLQLWLSGPGDAGPLLRDHRDAVVDATTVLPLGEPRDQAGRYARAWLTVHPAEFESFGMVLLESLACGTPVVAADHAALPELVRPGTGVLCTPRDPDALRKAVLEGLELTRDPASAGRCREFAAAYAWDTAVAPALEQAYSP